MALLRVFLVNPEEFYLERRHTSEKDGYVDRLNIPFQMKKERATLIRLLEKPVSDYVEDEESKKEGVVDLTDAFNYSYYGFLNSKMHDFLYNIFRVVGKDEKAECLYVEYFK